MAKYTLSDEMTKNLVSIKKNEKMEEAYRLMYCNKIRHLPVVDTDGDIVGILSDRDVQRAMRSDISESFGFKLESVEFKENSFVEDYMSWPVKTFEKETDIKLVLQKMIDEKVSAYLILDKEEVVGIVTTDDFLHLLMKLLDEDKEPKQMILGDVLANPLFGRVAQTVSDLGI